ncbi:hypothetical protein BGX28_007732 [Mortierella sp. GBA30]|nr:hypothetical protein BGX28_007732 [Mortierella sp. GBA30]
MHFPNLKSLTLVQSWKQSAKLISRNPTLCFLYLDNRKHDMEIPSIWRAALGLTKLQMLHLENIMVAPGEQADDFWRVASTVKDLEVMKDSTVAVSTLSSTIPLNASIVKLGNIPNMSVGDQVELLAHCPRLKRLTWQVRKDGLETLATRMSEDIWSEFTELHLYAEQHATVGKDQALADIIRNMKPVIYLYCVRLPFGMESFKALRNHVDHVTTIHLMNCERVSGAIVHGILASCTRLEKLIADQMAVKDVEEDGRYWACSRSLRVLVVCIFLGGSNEEMEQQNRFILERLSTLTSLRVLRMARENQRPRVKPVIFDLTKGLEKLITLTELREIRVYHRLIFRADVQWMFDHWKNLKRLFDADRELKKNKLADAFLTCVSYSR